MHAHASTQRYASGTRLWGLLRRLLVHVPAAHATHTRRHAHDTKRCDRPQEFTPLGARGDLQSLPPGYAVRHAAMLCTAVKLDASQVAAACVCA